MVNVIQRFNMDVLNSFSLKEGDASLSTRLVLCRREFPITCGERGLCFVKVSSDLYEADNKATNLEASSSACS